MQSLTIIAELGINFNGDLAVMYELIRSAKLNGADMCKIQLYESNTVFGNGTRSIYEITKPQFAKLCSHAEDVGIPLFASVFDEERFEWCEEMNISCYKVAHKLHSLNPVLVDRILATGKTVYVTGANTNSNAIRLQLSGGYPTLEPEKFNKMSYHGISDHTLGISYALHSIAHGATVVEKHYTLSKVANSAHMTGDGNDHVFSMDEKELMFLNTYGRELAKRQENMA